MMGLESWGRNDRPRLSDRKSQYRNGDHRNPIAREKMTSPTLTYDRDANALYIRFSTNAIEETVELSESVYVDVDRDGEPVGFEILDAASSHLAGIPALPETAALSDLLK